MSTNNNETKRWETQYDNAKDAVNKMRREGRYLCKLLVIAVIALAVCIGVATIQADSVRMNFFLYAALYFTSGLMGSTIFGIKTFCYYVANGGWSWDKGWWRVCSPWLAACMAMVIGFMVCAGYVNAKQPIAGDPVYEIPVVVIESVVEDSVEEAVKDLLDPKKDETAAQDGETEAVAKTDAAEPEKTLEEKLVEAVTKKLDEKTEELNIYKFNESNLALAISIGFFAGYFADKAAGKMNDVAKILFGSGKDEQTEKPETEDNDNPAPALENADEDADNGDGTKAGETAK